MGTAVAHSYVGTDSTKNLGVANRQILKSLELLDNVTLIDKPVSLQSHGLINKGNWCYINATMQALVACPPMYHLMKFIPLYSKTQRPCTSTPMIDSFVWLMNEFTNMPVPPKFRQAKDTLVSR